MAQYKLNVNGTPYTATVDNEDTPLLWVLRDILGLTGTKYGCGIEICGACMVLVDGEAEKSCDMSVREAVGRKIVTVEGLSADPHGKAVQAAWEAHQVPQCGFCQPGMMIAATGALKDGHRGREIAEEIENICMCGTYERIKKACQTL
jgi:isoquinoline 1-oxidoreductase alpha subunit